LVQNVKNAGIFGLLLKPLWTQNAVNVNLVKLVLEKQTYLTLH